MSDLADVELNALTDLDGCIIGYYARGWHEPSVFVAALADHRPTAPRITPDAVRREHWRCVPTIYNDDRMMMFTKARRPGRGAFQVTVWEA